MYTHRTYKPKYTYVWWLYIRFKTLSIYENLHIKSSTNTYCVNLIIINQSLCALYAVNRAERYTES